MTKASLRIPVSSRISDVAASPYCQPLFVDIEDLNLSRITGKHYLLLGTPIFQPDPVASFEQTQEQIRFEGKAELSTQILSPAQNSFPSQSLNVYEDVFTTLFSISTLQPNLPYVFLSTR